MIVFAHDNQGNFIAGDTDTGVTGYAYSSSTYADMAKCSPDRVAKLMLHNTASGQDYNQRNWERLNQLLPKCDHCGQYITGPVHTHVSDLIFCSEDCVAKHKESVLC
jgi:hypothetical protein